MDNDFGEFIEKLRGKIPLREVADKSGLSHTYIRDLELGKNRKTKAPIKPSPEILRSLAKAYNHPYKDLMIRAGYDYEEEKEEPSIEETDRQKKIRRLHELANEAKTEKELDSAIIVLESIFKK